MGWAAPSGFGEGSVTRVVQASGLSHSPSHLLQGRLSGEEASEIQGRPDSGDQPH